MNQFPLWKNLLVLGVLVIGLLVALPNIYGNDPALQVSREDGAALDESTMMSIRAALEEASIPILRSDLEDGRAMVRFGEVPHQRAASNALRDALAYHVVALTLAPRTPDWLRALGLKPMSLGLDLRGGVHFLYEVDLKLAIEQYLGTYRDDINRRMLEERLRRRVQLKDGFVEIQVLRAEDADRAEEIIRELDDPNNPFRLTRTPVDGLPGFRLSLTDAQIKARQDFAIQQNTVTLRNRVNELGVAEPVVQRQGLNRIVVQLPGVQDPSQAERVLGATATLEFRLVDTQNDAFDADRC